MRPSIISDGAMTCAPALAYATAISARRFMDASLSMHHASAEGAFPSLSVADDAEETEDGLRRIMPQWPWSV